MPKHNKQVCLNSSGYPNLCGGTHIVNKDSIDWP